MDARQRAGLGHLPPESERAVARRASSAPSRSTIPAWDWRTFDLGSRRRLRRPHASHFSNADLRRLLHSRRTAASSSCTPASADPVVPAQDIVAYYDDVVAGHGRSARRRSRSSGSSRCLGWATVRAAPGRTRSMRSVPSSAGAKHGVAPDVIAGVALGTNGLVDRTRPSVPYPQVARYSGFGNIERDSLQLRRGRPSRPGPLALALSASSPSAPSRAHPEPAPVSTRRAHPRSDDGRARCGFGLGHGQFILTGMQQTASVAAMFVFAILYFGVMTDAGMLDPIVDRILRGVGTRPTRIVMGSALLALLVHLDGSGAVTFLVTIPRCSRSSNDSVWTSGSSRASCRWRQASTSCHGPARCCARRRRCTSRRRPLPAADSGAARRPGVRVRRGVQAGHARGATARAPTVAMRRVGVVSRSPANGVRRPGRFWINVVLTVVVMA